MSSTLRKNTFGPIPFSNASYYQYSQSLHRYLEHCHPRIAVIGSPPPTEGSLTTASPAAASEIPTVESRSSPAAHSNDVNRHFYQFALGYPQTPPTEYQSAPHFDPIAPAPKPQAPSSEMGTFVFNCSHPASEVFATGTFDDWGKTEKLEKKDDIFEKEVSLPKADEKILYKVSDNSASIQNPYAVCGMPGKSVRRRMWAAG